MRRLFAMLLGVTALVVIAEGSAAARPSLRPIGFAPLTFVGRGFAPGERVKVTVYTGAPRVLSRVADAAGGFKVGFAIRQPRCTAWVVRAVGSRGSRVSYRAPVDQCKPPAAAGAPPPATGTGITGVVRRGPLTPVCVAETPCDGPAAGVGIDIVQGGTVIGHVSTGTDGHYYVLVISGDYVVRAAGRGLAPLAVHVQRGRFAEVDFMIDTGIR